jgi:hypothetical protein
MFGVSTLCDRRPHSRHDQADNEQHKEYEKQDLRDAGCCAGDAAEAECCGN